MSFDVPVVIFLFNRPGPLARVVDVLRRVQPRFVLLIADGPRPDQPQDTVGCAGARAVVERLDWPCDVARDFSDQNMGLTKRMTSGLDWAFRQVSEAIVLEDDIVPDPTFFPWCERMLDRYRDETDVMHVSGRNHLGRWTELGDGHCLVHRASVWGWATWRRAWRLEVSTPGNPDDIRRVAARLRTDPLVTETRLMLQQLASASDSPCWDTVWEIKKALVGGLSVIPSVNLVAHIGFGSDSTHNKFVHDIGALTPVGRAPSGEDADRCAEDQLIDRWSLLFELMATYREPTLAWRFARATLLGSRKPWEDDVGLRHHLAPFRNPREALAVLQHFCAAGAPAEPLKDLFDALGRATADMPAEPC